MNQIVTIGTTELSLLNPPQDGIVIHNGRAWRMGRNGSGNIVLRLAGQCHPEFVSGMDMQTFCEWVNSHLGCGCQPTKAFDDGQPGYWD